MIAGPVRYTAADLLEKNKGGVGQGLLDLLDDVCTNDLVGKGSRSSRYRSVEIEKFGVSILLWIVKRHPTF